MFGFGFSQAWSSTAPCAKGIIRKTLLWWCRINAAVLGLQCFYKDSHCTPKAVASVGAFEYVSWHSDVQCMHTRARAHTWWMCAACHVVLFAHFLLHRCISVSPPSRENVLHYNYRMNAGEGERTNFKESRLLFSMKREHGVLQPECRVYLTCNHTPPRPAPLWWSAGVWSWLASWSLLGEKVLEGLWPLPTSRQTAWPGTPWMPPQCASVMQFILVRHQKTDVASCWLHLYGNSLTRQPHEEDDTEKHVMLNGELKIHLKITCEDIDVSSQSLT